MNADESLHLAALVERVEALREVVKDLKGEYALATKELETSRLDRLTLHNENERLTRRTDALENLHHDHVATDELVHDKLDTHLGEHAKQRSEVKGATETLGVIDRSLLRLQGLFVFGIGIYVAFFK